MTLLSITASMVFPPLLVGLITLVSVRALNSSNNPGDDWVAIFLALMLGALTWIVSWTWIRIQTSKEESK